MTIHTFAEGQLVRHRQWRGVGRLVKLNLVAGTADVWFHSNGKVGMRTCSTDMLVPPRKTDTPPPAMPHMVGRGR